MQLARPNAIVSLTAAVDLTGCAGRFVTLSSGNVTLISSALATPFGVLLSDGAAGQKVSVAVAAGGLSGTVRVKLSAAVAAPGTFLQLTATGTVIPNNTATAARVVCGLALEAGQVGELIESVMFNPLAYPYANGGGGGGDGVATSIATPQAAYVRAGTVTVLNPYGLGIEVVCSIGYIDLFLNGEHYALQQDGVTVRGVYHCLLEPSASMDSDHGYVVGSRRTHDDGRVFQCDDATAGAAVWVDATPLAAGTDGTEGFRFLEEGGMALNGDLYCGGWGPSVGGSLISADNRFSSIFDGLGSIALASDTTNPGQWTLSGAVVVDSSLQPLSSLFDGTGGWVLNAEYANYATYASYGFLVWVDAAGGPETGQEVLVGNTNGRFFDRYGNANYASYATYANNANNGFQVYFDAGSGPETAQEVLVGNTNGRFFDQHGNANTAGNAQYDSITGNPLSSLFDGTGGSVAFASSALFDGATSNQLSSLFDGTGGSVATANYATNDTSGSPLSSVFDGTGGFVAYANSANYATNDTSGQTLSSLFDGTGGYVAIADFANNANRGFLVYLDSGGGHESAREILVGSTNGRFFDRYGIANRANTSEGCTSPVFVGAGTRTVSQLPVGSAAGSRAVVTDALSPVFGNVVAAGGAVHVPVYKTTTGWRVG